VQRSLLNDDVSWRSGSVISLPALWKIGAMASTASSDNQRDAREQEQPAPSDGRTAPLAHATGRGARRAGCCGAAVIGCDELSSNSDKERSRSPKFRRLRTYVAP